ncbi:MAG: mandelate racemase/muconate lactonizing enzyme family protein, partial [Candidatus Hodarchaeota archaeon]
RGFRQLKMKAGLSPKLDLERVKAVRDAVGYDITLGIDANQAWKPHEAIKVIRKMEKYDLAWIEQPVPRWNIEGLSEVKRAVDTPLMADESLKTLQDAIHLIKRDAVSMFNIKIAKHGGLYNAKKIVAIAEASGVFCMVGMLYEYGIAAAAGFHFAASTKMLPLGNEIIEGPLMIQDDLITKPLKISRGFFEVPKGYGLGIELDEVAVSKYAERFKSQRKR